MNSESRFRYLPFVLLGVALLARLLLLTLPGFRQDVSWYVTLGEVLYSDGLLEGYDHPERVSGLVVNYFPLALTLLWVISPLLMLAKSSAIAWLPGAIHRLPAIAADLAIAWLLYRTIRNQSPTSKPAAEKEGPALTPSIAVLALALFNPGPLYVGAGYGQMESVAMLGIVGSVLLLLRGKPAWSGLCAGLALGFKMQVLVLMPALAVLALLRCRIKGVIVWSALCIPTLFLPWLPFILAGKAHAAWQSTFVLNSDWSRHLSSGAFNVWALTHNPLLPDLLPLELFFSEDGTISTGSLLAFFTYRRVGLLLFAAGYAAAIALLYRFRNERQIDWWFLAAVGYLFFAFPTRIHERYLLSFLILSLPIIVLYRSWPRRLCFGLLSLVYPVNLLVIAPLSGNSPELADIPHALRFFCGALTLAAGAWLLMPPCGESACRWPRPKRAVIGWCTGVTLIFVVLSLFSNMRTEEWRDRQHLQDIPFAEPPAEHWLIAHQRGLSVDRNALTVDGTIWARGLGMHAASHVVFDVTGPSRLRGAVGIDDETLVYARGELAACIIVNGATTFESGPLHSGKPPAQIAIELPNDLNRLELHLDPRGVDLDDHADWLGMAIEPLK